MLEPSSDTLKRSNLIHHSQGVILLFSRERTMCHRVLNSFRAHNVLFASVTVSSSRTAWTFQKLAELTVPCALCLRTLAWPLAPKQAFWVLVPGVKVNFPFPFPPFYISTCLVQSCQLSYPRPISVQHPTLELQNSVLLQSLPWISQSRKEIPVRTCHCCRWTSYPKISKPI